MTIYILWETKRVTDFFHANSHCLLNIQIHEKLFTRDYIFICKVRFALDVNNIFRKLLKRFKNYIKCCIQIYIILYKMKIFLLLKIESHNLELVIC